MGSRIFFLFMLSIVESQIEVSGGELSRKVVCGTKNCTYEEVCNSDKCDSVTSYHELITSTTPTKGKDYNAFKVAMISDMQFYYTNCKQQRKICIFKDIGLDQNDYEDLLDNAVLNQVTCVKNQVAAAGATPYKLIIDGGDLTNEGDNSTKNTYETSVYKNLQYSKTKIPMALVLGNHDYYWHWNDTVDTIPTKQENAARMIHFLKGNLLNELNNSDTGAHLLSVDWKETETEKHNGEDVLMTKGSLMYSIEIEGIVFIMTHWAPALKYGTPSLVTFSFTDGWEVAKANSTSGKHELYSITDGYDWLEIQLKKADAAKKKVVFVPHFVEGLRKYLDSFRKKYPFEDSSKDLTRYVGLTGLAILTGHDHDQWGYYGHFLSKRGKVEITHESKCPFVDDSTNSRSCTEKEGMPIYYAVSASYQKYISVELHNTGARNGKISVTSHDSTSQACTVTTADNSD